jgi:putative transposase
MTFTPKTGPAWSRETRAAEGAAERVEMKKSRYSEEQIIGILKEHEAGMETAELCRKHNVSAATFYQWKAKFGGLEASDAKKLRHLEQENAKLKRVVADLTLDNVVLKDLLSKNW